MPTTFPIEGAVLNSPEHEVSDIRAGNSEAKKRKVPLSYAIFPGVRLVCEFGWASYGPVQSALFKHPLHSGCVGNNPGKKEFPKKVGGRDDRVLKEEGNRLDHDAPDRGVQHGASQRGRELL